MRRAELVGKALPISRRDTARGLVCALLVMLFGLSEALALPDWGAGKRYALIVGVDAYQNDQVVDLKYAVSDAELLKQVLVEHAQFDEKNIFLLTTGATAEANRPLLTNIVFRLEWLRDIVGPGDTLVFYFAGHGVDLENETFLMTEEADQRSRGTLMISSLRGSVLQELLKATGAQNTLVLLDACRNDPTAGRGDGDNPLSEAMARGLVFVPAPSPVQGLERNSATVFACSEGERSWEWSEKRHGFFTYYLAEALKEGAYDSQGRATLQRTLQFLRENVRESAHRVANITQTPMMRYEGPDPESWVLAQSLVKGRDLATPTPEQLLSTQERAELIARTEAAELEAKRSQEALLTAKAREDVREAEMDVLVKENELLKARAEGREAETAELELELAQDNLRLAKELVQASVVRHAASESAFGEAVLRVEASQIGREVYSLAFGQQADSPEVLSLKERLTELEKSLAKMESEKREAVERALLAERQLARLQADLDAKWEGRALGKRPTRRTKREDLWRVVDPGVEEADTL